MRTSLYGRRMYELMSGYWPTAEDDPDAKPVEVEFARIWKNTPRVVFSRTLKEVGWNSRLVREGAVDEVAQAQEGARRHGRRRAYARGHPPGGRPHR